MALRIVPDLTDDEAKLIFGEKTNATEVYQRALVPLEASTET